MPIQLLAAQTNLASLETQKHMVVNEQVLSSAMSRLSSGLRINQAADDAAGLSISEKLRAQIRGLAQCNRNAMDGISMLQTAESALNEITNMLIRMRELSIQSASGHLTSNERAYLHDEFNELRSEITRISNVIEFNGRKLLNGGLSTGLTFQVGILNTFNDRITISMLSASAGSIGISAAMTITSVTGARDALNPIDSAIKAISLRRGRIGANQNRLYSTINNLNTAHQNLSAANSRIRDADIAQESANLTKGQILMQSGIAVLTQANQLPVMALGLLS